MDKETGIDMLHLMKLQGLQALLEMFKEHKQRIRHAKETLVQLENKVDIVAMLETAWEFNEDITIQVALTECIHVVHLACMKVVHDGQDQHETNRRPLNHWRV